MDIRNWFRPIGDKAKVTKDDVPKEKKRKKIIESDEEEEPIPSKLRKHKILVSDSDDEIFEIPKKSEKKEAAKAVASPKVSKPIPKPETPKLKPATATDFFGTSKVSQKTNVSAKRKIERVLDVHSDDEFEKTLQQLDQSYKKKVKKESKVNESGESSHTNKVVTPSRTALASKLASKVKKESDIKMEKNVNGENPIKQSQKESQSTPKIKKEITTPTEERKLKETLKKESTSGTTKEKNETDTKKRKLNYDTPKKNENKNSASSVKIEESSKKFEADQQQKNVNDDKKQKEFTNKKQSKSLPKSTPKKTKIQKYELLKEKTEDIPAMPEPDERSKQQTNAYKKYLQRSGPRNPGSKPLPEGEPECLVGLTFVVTGVLESIDREETTELIKKYGGRITTSISRNTSYLVVGDEPGESKLKKAEQIGTKQITEDELFNLISTSTSKLEKSSTNKGKYQTPKSQAGSSKLSQFKKDSKKKTSVTSSEEIPLTQSPKTKISTDGTSFSSPSSQGSYGSSTNSPQGSTQSLSSQELVSRSSESLMWVDKYKPSSLKNIIGQQGDSSNAKKLLNWLKSWFENQSGKKKLVRPSPWAKDNTGAFFKAALLSGPPGVGKTTSAHLVCKELKFDVVELNASDARSKKALDEVVTELLSNKSLGGFASGEILGSPSRNHVLLMDEVDGMSGNEDRGGVSELVGLIKCSKVPIICMCNDRNHPKIRTLANYCFDLRFQKPKVEQIRGAMMSVCFREGIKIKPDALDQVIMGSNQDIRQVLHHLSMWSADDKNLSTDQMKKDSNMSKKDLKFGPWDVCQKVFNEAGHKTMSIHDKVSLFFHDYSIGPLFVQENYLKVSPHCAKGNPHKLLEQVAKTANSLSDSDLIDNTIRRNQAWSLLPVQALYSSVLPGEYMAGHFSSAVEFPKWLGNNSRKNKFDRLSQELHLHMRLNISGSKQDIITDYSSRLKDLITQPLIKDGSEGVKDAVAAMTSYDLLREDLESITELSTWPGIKDKMANVESKVKAAFTRALNKDSHLNPFSTVTSVVKKKGRALSDDIQDVEENVEDEEEEDDDDDDDDDVANDGMIKQGKMTQTKDGKKSTASSSSKGKGKGKGKP